MVEVCKLCQRPRLHYGVFQVVVVVVVVVILGTTPAAPRSPRDSNSETKLDPVHSTQMRVCAPDAVSRIPVRPAPGGRPKTLGRW
jgi:hypothetical protein